MNRKSISMSIDKDGVPLIKAPYSVSADIINSFYNDRLDWVRSRQSMYEVCEAQRREALASEVNSLPLFGREYPVTHENRQYGFDWKTFNLPSESFAEMRSYIISMYRRIAAADLPKRVEKYSEIIGVHPCAVKINSASTRWGSCPRRNGKGFWTGFRTTNTTSWACPGRTASSFWICPAPWRTG